MELRDVKIITEKGEEFYGTHFGAKKEVVCELVFNTSPVGYQEIVSDPTYLGQGVVMTYPVIGNYGICDDDYELRNPALSALIVRDYNDHPSNFRSTKTLSEILEDNGIPGITGVDTRKLTRHIRDNGTLKAIICSPETTKEQAYEKMAFYKAEQNPALKVSARKYWYSRTAHHHYNVVVVDIGLKQSVVKELNKRGCNVTVVLYNTSFESIKNLKPDGIFISNGPGDPELLSDTISVVKELIGVYPTFGIGQGHNVIALSMGAKCYKLKFGHHGANYPVRELENGKIEITNQNQNYSVSKNSLVGTSLTATMENVLDGIIEGLEDKSKKVFSVGFYPDGSSREGKLNLYDKFIQMMKEGKENA